MGWFSLLAPCLRCGQLFTSNPYRVPSVRIGRDQHPVCRSCLDEVNQGRVGLGLDPFPILPGAYDPEPEDDEFQDDPADGPG